MDRTAWWYGGDKPSRTMGTTVEPPGVEPEPLGFQSNMRPPTPQFHAAGV